MPAIRPQKLGPRESSGLARLPDKLSPMRHKKTRKNAGLVMVVWVLPNRRPIPLILRSYYFNRYDPYRHTYRHTVQALSTGQLPVPWRVIQVDLE